ncbi:MAG: ABC transporter substrate-binding protein [Rhodospirillales bacterium]|nr:ABC transporter substrate-binding protein [Rhodospirillales bacterium]
MLLAASVALAGCTTESGFGGMAGQGGAALSLEPGAGGPPSNRAPSGRGVALLAPLSGPNAALGPVLEAATKLALSVPGSPRLDVRDTGGTPQGAAAAAQAAIAAGAGLILGPLTYAETAAAAGPAQSAGVGMLAFTNDPSVARPGVWTLGITPRQQVFRLVAAAKAEGRQRFAALLPDSPFGQAMGAALTAACQAAGLAAPDIRTPAASMDALAAQVRELSDYAGRRGPIEAQIRALRQQRPKGWYQRVQALRRTRIPPPPIDALLLADTGDRLVEIGTLLPYYDLDTTIIRVMGPSLWADPQMRAGARIGGAWYAAPDPADRADFVRRATAAGQPAPPAIADIAYDAAAVARVVAGEGGFARSSLERGGGFAGADGVFELMADGSVRRALAVFDVVVGGADTVASPAPASVSGPAI